MSTLSVGTIKSGTSGSPPTIQDSGGTEVGTFCRAWVNFNGTGTVAIRASFNVTSITDNGTGDYTVNFTNALTDANYSTVCNREIAASANAPYFAEKTSGTKSTSQIQLIAVGAGTAQDISSLSVAIFR